MEIDAKHFVDRFNEIRGLYVEVKAIIILAENVDKDKDAYIAPINELRNTLDHLMRSLEYPDRLDSEFSEAKEHLYRAGYDTYEILAINLAEKIVKTIEIFPTLALTSIFPKYYTEIKPVLIDLQVELADTRAHKRLDPETGTKSFSIYQQKIDNLIRLIKVTDKVIPDLENENRKLENNKAKAKKDKRKDRTITFIFGLCFAIIAQIGLKYFYDHFIATTPAPTPTVVIPNNGKKVNSGTDTVPFKNKN